MRRQSTAVRLYQSIATFGVVAILLAAQAEPVHAECHLKDTSLHLTLPTATIAVSRSAPVGATLSTVRVAATQDIHFSCTKSPNEREVRLDARWKPSTDLAGVYRTNIDGLGIRVSAKGGNFAGIDDAARQVPYKVPLSDNADTLTGFSVQVDFIKTGPVQDGAIEAGPLLSVLAGNAPIADVSFAAGSIVAISRQCDPTPRAGGMVTAGVGTMGSFSQEAVIVSAGCDVGVTAVIATGTPYIYGREVPKLKKLPVPRDPSAFDGTSNWTGGTATGSFDMSRTDAYRMGPAQDAGRFSGIHRQ